MRRAKPHELKTRAVPAMTARLSEAELDRWVPIEFDEITDPLATPEPSKGALVKLESGAYVVLYYGYDSKQLMVEIPETTHDSSALVAAFFGEVPLPVSRVLWHRPDIRLPSRRRRSTPAAAASAKSRRGTPVDTGTASPKRSARRVALPRREK
jgi:hypothetical protein